MDEFQHRIAEQKRVFAVVKPPRHFVEVSREMLCGDSMPRSDDAALQERKGRLDGVCVELVVYILLCAMVYYVMLCCWHRSLAESSRISNEIIRHNHVNIGGDILADVLRQSAALRIFRVEESQIATTFSNTDDNLFRIFASPHTLADSLSPT